GDAFGTMAEKINGIDFEKFGRQVRDLLGFINQIREALGYLQTLSINVGNALGLDHLGDAAFGGRAYVSAFSDGLFLTNQRGIQRRIDDAFSNAVETAA